MSATPPRSGMPVARRSTSRGRWMLAALGSTAAAALLAAAPPAAADTTWGDTGASYSGGITCHLRGGTVVPMATWDVDSTATFATADISESGGSYGPAPTSGAARAMRPGDAGLDGSAIATAAYLIDHNGSGPAPDVAEVSAEIAALAGGGGVQSRCLGQEGTSRKKATALLTEAQRYAGPYKVALSLPPHAPPGKPAAIAATVTSAAGAPTPGLDVTFSVNGGSAVAVTGQDGVARTQVTTPAATTGAAAVPITASINQAVSLTYYATDPGAVSLAAPTSVTVTGSLTPVLHPTPHVSTQVAGLVLQNATVTPHATITGTYGYAGQGALTLHGPVQPAHGQDCSDLTSADYAKAPTAWTANFGFVGDGTHDGGATPPLAAGCYAAHASITTTNTAPPAKASTGYGSTVVVSTLQLSESTGPGVVGAGGLAATVTGAHPGGAAVTTSITVHGPVTPNGGSCSAGMDWNQAPIDSVSDAADLAAAAGSDSLSATIKMPQVQRAGCYALSSRSVVSQDGHTTVVEPAVGSTGSTELLARPTLAVTDSAYDGQVGKPMTGTITVVGSYRFAGTLNVGLISAPRTDVGCRGTTFASTRQSGAVVTSATAGDGTVRFTTPPPKKNLCYAVTAVLRLTANPAVQATSPAPSTSSVFLAGDVLRSPTLRGIPGGDDDALLQTAIAGGITLLIIFAVAFVVIARAYARRGPRIA